MTEQTSTTRSSVVIAGGGVAALEALIALHDLAGDHVDVTLVAPDRDFVYRPLSVAEPFCLGHAAHHSLPAIARDFGADVVSGALAEVDADDSRIVLSDGASSRTTRCCRGRRPCEAGVPTRSRSAQTARPRRLPACLPILRTATRSASRSSSPTGPPGAFRFTSLH